jgi:molybdopterin converting factor small subunit
MRVKLRLFATYREYIPPGNDGNTIEVEVPTGTRVVDIMSMYNIPVGQESVILLNGVSPHLDENVNDGDIISAFPAMAGG